MSAGHTPRSAVPVELLTKSAVLRRLELEVHRRLDGVLTGEHLTRAIGPGSERAGARRYAPGDDARRIDWNLTARSLEPHVRTTEADRELDTLVVVDRSPSLDFGTARQEKRDVVLAVVAAYGVLTQRSGNKFAVLVAGGPSLVPLPHRSGRAGLLAALSRVYDTDRHDQSPPADADLGAALERARRTKHRRGMVVVASDFLDRSAWPDALRQLAMRHHVVAVHITDPREQHLVPVGMLSVVDVESGRQMHVQTNSPRLRERYATAARERHERIATSIRRSGADYLDLSTDRDWVLDLARFVGRKGLRPR